MENEIFIGESQPTINSMELLCRFILECKNIAQGEEYYPASLCSADILTAVYYFRKYPNVDDFINNIYKSAKSYFQLHWIRSIWSRFSKMSQAELSELVINQITLVANLQEEQ